MYEKMFRQSFSKKANRKISRFASICSHELKEPLRSIANYIQLIKQYHITGMDDSSKHYLKAIYENVNYMETLVQSLYNYSQLDFWKLKFEPLQMKEIIAKILIILDNLIRSKNAVIESTNIDNCVFADRILITVVLQNLVSNALYFNDKKHPIVKITMQTVDNEFNQFAIQDNGIGINSKYWNKIFYEFVRLNPSSYSKGSGMGLSFCKKIINAHGGKIWVKSKVGVGSTFYFTLHKAKIRRLYRKRFLSIEPLSSG